MGMTLDELIVTNEQMDNVLMEEEGIERMLGSDDSIEELMDILSEQVENRLTQTVLSLDTFITINGENMSIMEAQLKYMYFNTILQQVAKLGMADRFAEVIQEMVALNKAIQIAVLSTEIPEPVEIEEEVTDNTDTPDSVV